MTKSSNDIDHYSSENEVYSSRQYPIESIEYASMGMERFVLNTNDNYSMTIIEDENRSKNE